MECKFCGTPLEDEQDKCPSCGQDQSAPEELVSEAPAEEMPAAVSEKPAAEPYTAAHTEEPVQKKKSGALLAVVAVVAIAVLAVAAYFIVKQFSDKPANPGEETQIEAPGEQGETEQESSEQGVLIGELNEIEFAMTDEEGNYLAHDFGIAPADMTEEQARAVVAKCAGYELDNTTFSYYYWQTYYNFMSSYGMYLIDSTISLSEQMYSETNNWQDILAQNSMSSFQQNAALAAEAEAAGHSLDEEYSEYLKTMPESLASSAQDNGFETGDAYLQALYGPYASEESYLAYAKMTFLASSYINEKFKEIQLDEETISAYYDENEENFLSQGIEKDDTYLIDVRHILVIPAADEDAEVDENGTAILTDENWADALARAEEIYTEWQAGEATEESFAALAGEYTEDGGSKSTGGLYESVSPGEMVTEFNDWCFDKSRQSGDTEIVKTSYGYHIMYFSATTDELYWYGIVSDEYYAAQQQKLVNEIIEKSGITTYYDKLSIADVTLS